MNFEAKVLKVAAQIIASDSTRDELARQCARADVRVEKLAEELRTSQGHFRMLLNDFMATFKALKETADPSKAKQLVEKTQHYNFTGLIDVARAATVTANARKAALARHAPGSPMADAKAIVYECWLAWNGAPAQYRSTSAFARAMLDKFPDDLTASEVVERWVRSWRK